MAGIFNYTWSQGEDLDIGFTYKVGVAGATPAPVDLTGYSLRMDIVPEGGTQVLYTVNSNDFDASTVDEAVLGSDGAVAISVPRSVLLPGGALFDAVTGGVTEFNYDCFLKNAAGKYTKVLKGKIYIDRSVTLW